MKNFIVQIKLLFLSNTVKQKYNFPREINAKMKFRSHDMKLIPYPRFSDSLSSLLLWFHHGEKDMEEAHFPDFHRWNLSKKKKKNLRKYILTKSNINNNPYKLFLIRSLIHIELIATNNCQIHDGGGQLNLEIELTSYSYFPSRILTYLR